MILPSKHIPQEKALLTIGATLLKRLNCPKTVSAIWEEVRQSTSIDYDWFVLSLDLLFTIKAIEINEGVLSRLSLS